MVHGSWFLVSGWRCQIVFFDFLPMVNLMARSTTSVRVWHGAAEKTRTMNYEP
jgi:hypothetical protein